LSSSRIYERPANSSGQEPSDSLPVFQTNGRIESEIRKDESFDSGEGEEVNDCCPEVNPWYVQSEPQAHNGSVEIPLQSNLEGTGPSKQFLEYQTEEVPGNDECIDDGLGG
jgi:hypothetical protein